MLKERIFIAQKAAVQLGLRSRGLRSTHLIPRRLTRKTVYSRFRGIFSIGKRGEEEEEKNVRKEGKEERGGRKRVSISFFFQEEQVLSKTPKDENGLN